MLIISDSLRNEYHGGFIGVILFKNVMNPELSPLLEKMKEELESTLRHQYDKFSRSGLASIEPIQTYVDYYKRFKKTYHVLLQLESVVFKNRSLPNMSPLVEAMFMAELKNQFLTAGHDLDTIKLPIKVEVSKGSESYSLLNGQEKKAVQGDMMMTDGNGIISSIIYGPDHQTKIRKNTKNVIYVVYAPPGIKEISLNHHLQDIKQYVQVVSPDAVMELQQVYTI